MKKNIVIVLMVIALAFAAGFINSTNETIKSYGSISPTGPFRPIRSENDSDNVYFTLYDTRTGEIWNEDGSVFVATDDASVTGANYDNIAITCTDLRLQAEDGWMPVLPTALSGENSNFEADITFYNNASPDPNDAILIGRHCYIKATTIDGTYLSRIYSMNDL